MPKGIYQHNLHTKEHNNHIAKSSVGHIVSVKTKNKISKSLIGHKCSEETVRKISKSMKGKLCRENHWNWKGGKSFEPYSSSWTETLKRAIRERDGYICKLCEKTQIEELEKLEIKLSVHHIDYDKKNCNPENLITLCSSCNSKVNFNRKYWQEKFMPVLGWTQEEINKIK
jgi:5-methylcytosine-specific restriction endonuclease McrA